MLGFKLTDGNWWEPQVVLFQPVLAISTVVCAYKRGKLRNLQWWLSWQQASDWLNHTIFSTKCSDLFVLHSFVFIKSTICHLVNWWCLLSIHFMVHDDVIKWKHDPLYWPFVRGIHRSPVNSPHRGQWRGALMFCLICALNKLLSKQSWSWWFETPLRP